MIFMAGEDGDMHEISLSRCIDDEIRLSKDLAKAKDAAEAANRTKSTFLFNMSHDIRTPMNAIMGFTGQALQHIGDSGKLKDYLKKIKTSSDYMLKLLNSVLEMARIEKGKLTLIVQDTGIGMSEEFLPNIFDGFERERNETTKEIQGTGLGMGITKKLLEIMGGTIEVESRLGIGTTVTVKIPFGRVVPRSAFRENAHPEDFADLLRGKRLLLAEDNDLNAEIAMEILGEAGLLVERAADGVECVSMLYREAPQYYDAILMDIQMPDLDGYMATEKIRRLNDPQKSNIPIIAMTANAFKEDRKKALDKGMDGFVPKPVEMNKLFETLAGVMRPYRQS